jgi:hypothetical protein
VHYRAHGLTIASDRPLPELVEAGPQETPDLTVRFDSPPPDPGESSTWFESPYRTPAGTPELVARRLGQGRWLEFAYADGTRFLVDGGLTEIRVSGAPTLTAAGVAEYLLGPILGIVLRLRGVVCLHASAITIGGHAYAFVGAAGAGKSTMAAAFGRAGVPVLSDDTITLTPRASSWLVAPAYPRVRLWPESVSALGLAGGMALPPEDGDAGTRHQFDLASAGVFARDAVPLAGIYLIEFEDGLAQPRIDDVAAADALPVLSANTFAHRVLDRARRAQEFDTLAGMLASVPVRRLARARDLSQLGQVRAAILADIGGHDG